MRLFAKIGMSIIAMMVLVLFVSTCLLYIYDVITDPLIVGILAVITLIVGLIENYVYQSGRQGYHNGDL